MTVHSSWEIILHFIAFQSTRISSPPCLDLTVFRFVRARRFDRLNCACVWFYLLDFPKCRFSISGAILRRIYLIYVVQHYCWDIEQPLHFRYVGIQASEINHTGGRYDAGLMNAKPPYDCGMEVHVHTTYNCDNLKHLCATLGIFKL